MATASDKLWKQVKTWLNGPGGDPVPAEDESEVRDFVMEQVSAALEEKNGYLAAKVLEEDFDWSSDQELVAILHPHCTGE